MADEITVKDEGGGSFQSHSEGSFSAVCVDVIDLGERLKTYQGTDPKVAKTLALVFVTEERDEKGKLIEISSEMTVSMFERAALRQFLEGWRGKSYTDEQAKAGVPLHKLVGNGAWISIEHKESRSKRTYAKIKSISPLPKGLPIPDGSDYIRGEYWAKRKAAYAEEVAKFRKQSSADDEYESLVGDSSDDMPF